MHDPASHTAPVLVLMPYLGGSVREWRCVREILGFHFQSVGVDMPGFGDAAETPGYSVAEMAQYLIGQIRELKLTDYVLVGHSMSGKVAMFAASLLESEPERAPKPAGVVLIASSPLSPEPMSEDRRQNMIGDLGRSGEKYRQHAERFVRANCALALASDVLHGAVDDVLRMNCSAWTAWLQHGSKEDLTAQVPTLSTPALVIAGAKDSDLGEAAQTELVLPVFHSARLEVIAGAGHLMPMEAPEELARLLMDFVSTLEVQRGASA